MSAPPFMPLYLGEYFADTVHLSTLEHGAYFLLLTAMWRAGGRLPADDGRLARLTLCTADEWTEMRPTIMAFFTRSGGHITQKRLARELVKYATRVEGARKAGKASAEKRLNENNDDGSTTVELPLQRNPTNQNQNYNQKEEIEDVVSDETTPRAQPGAPTIDIFDDFPKGAFTLWYANYPHKVGRDAAARSFAAIQTARRATFAELERGLRFYISSKPPDRSWCNPATWLNQGRWKDQPAFVETANGTATQTGRSKSRQEESFGSLLEGAVATAYRRG